MPGLYVNDAGCIAVSVMKLEFVNAKRFCLLFRLDALAIFADILSAQTFLVNDIDEFILFGYCPQPLSSITY